VSRAQDLLTKALQFRKTEFLYDPQEGLTPQERKGAQKAIDRVFHRMEPDTVNIMATALEEELEKLRGQNAEQRILVQESDLPVKPILQEGRAAIQEILEHPQPDRRLKAFLGHTSLLKELKDYQERLRGFIEQGRPAEFRRARALKRAVERAQRVVPELAEKTVQGWLGEMHAIEEHREIVEKWATFYQNMQPLLQRYQEAYEAQHQARYDAYAQVKAELNELGVPTDSLGDRLCDRPVGWSLDGLTCTACGTGLETLYYQIQSAPEEKVRLVTQYVRRRKPEAGEKDTPRFEVVRLHEVIKTREITTVEELEAALNELREAVQATLGTGKRVILG
jgi:hypothetical protein